MINNSIFSYRTFFLLTFIMLNVSLRAQDQSNRPITEVLSELEDNYGIKFYYHNAWVDTLVFNGKLGNDSLDDILGQLFNGTSINYFKYNDRIILTKDISIIDDPEITKSFTSKEREVSVIEKGLVFSREYINQAQQSDLENYVFEIGNRNEMVTGGRSTIAGYVKNMENGEPIEGALVYVQNPFVASSTDEDGFYSLSIPNGKHILFIQFVGMKTTTRKIVLFSNGRMDIEMAVDVIALQEVLVESDRDINVSSVQMGVRRIDVEESKNIPILLGEKDLMKVSTTEAGVQTVGEGASGFNVRGGKSDQNLIILNKAPIYNASHFFGFFSVFNSEAIESMEVIKSGIPAKYGGRLSSVFDIRSKSANKTEVKGEGGISLITGRLTVEVPLIEEKTSLLLSGRTTYSNWLLNKTNDAEFKGNEVSFYDLNATLDHEFGKKDRLVLTGYFSRDQFKLASDTLFSFSNFQYSNSNATLNWSHQFNNNFDLNVSGLLVNYKYDLSFSDSPANAFNQDFELNEKSLEVELNNFIGERHTLNYGLGSKHYSINPGSKMPFGNESIISPTIVPREYGLESFLHISDQFEITDKFSIYGGIRYSMFNAIGPKEVFKYGGSVINVDTRVDSVFYKKGEVIKTYHGPEFRFSGRYSLNDLSSIKFSYNKTRQYVHVMSNSASLSPTDTWRLSDPHLLPQIADQISVGFYRNFLNNKFETSVETYYKFLKNLKDFKVGGEFMLNQFIERAILQGPGKSYGIEFSVRKKGKLNGWINYAYARSFIKLNGDASEEVINGGRYFPTSYDKPHTINLVSNYKVTRRFSISLNMTYNTGRPVTIPIAVYKLHDFDNVYYSDRNEYRIPDYFRVDFGMNLEGNHVVKKLSHSFWSFSIYNLLGRDNPYSVFFKVEDGMAKSYQLVVFGNPIPTISYNFKF
ncbi:MAG: carboxypeptidase-like regulatory domain-containing protein [Bacteroidota bacterium]